jgi:hypothetical protein
MSAVVEILPREFVERVAWVVGSGSAAAQALACADRGEHGTDPVFCRPAGGANKYLMVTARENLEALR